MCRKSEMIAGPGQSGADGRNRSITMARDRVHEIVPALGDRGHRLLPNTNHNGNPFVRVYEFALYAPRRTQQAPVGSGTGARPCGGIEQVGTTVPLATGEHVVQTREG